MTGFRVSIISCIALGATALPVLAGSGPVMVVGRAAPGLTVPMHQAAPSHRLIQISTMHRHVVGIMNQEDVVAPEVIQLQMGNQPIFVDPDRDYNRNTGGIDSGHSIMRAQRAYKAMTAQDTAYVIRRGEMMPVRERMMIMPHAILLRPDYMERRAPQNQQPMAPAPKPLQPKVKRGPVASAE